MEKEKEIEKKYVRIIKDDFYQGVTYHINDIYKIKNIVAGCIRCINPYDESKTFSLYYNHSDQKDECIIIDNNIKIYELW